MRKLIHFIILIFFISCGLNPDYLEVMVNKTVKVYSQNYHQEAENYFFKWEPPIGPSNQPIPFDLKNDMLIFSPIIEGDYQIHLSITDISDEVVAEEMFYYRAVPETLEVAIVKPKTDKKYSEPNLVIDKPKKKSPLTKKKVEINTQKESNKRKKKSNVNFTIQVSSWPSLEQARSNQLQLIEEGIDAYIERHYRTDKDEVWYRVRVGNISNKDTALEIQKQLDKISGKKSWLDIIHTN